MGQGVGEGVGQGVGEGVGEGVGQGVGLGVCPGVGDGDADGGESMASVGVPADDRQEVVVGVSVLESHRRHRSCLLSYYG